MDGPLANALARTGTDPTALIASSMTLLLLRNGKGLHGNDLRTNKFKNGFGCAASPLPRHSNESQTATTIHVPLPVKRLVICMERWMNHENQT